MLSNISAIISIIVILLFSYLKKQLTLRATFTALIVGIILYFCGGWLFLTALYAFFISSVLVSNIKRKYKNSTVVEIHKNSSNRDYVQVLANSGLAIISALIYYFTKNQIYEIAVLILFACYNADTWASELGVISNQEPVFIIGFKKAQKGISGAVTLLGLFSSFLGSLIIAILYLLFRLDTSISLVLIISIFGFLGALIDSILGQFFQVLYYDDKLNKFSEKRYNNGLENKKIKGHYIITNNVVNIFAPLLSVLLYFCVMFFLR